MLSFMLHDSVMSRGRKRGMPQPGSAEADKQCLDRRQSDRVPFPAEMVVVWNFDLDTPMRYAVIDAGDGGYRIHSSHPVQEGTTGMVLRLLPGRGQALDQPVMVAWTRPSDAGDAAAGFDVGLRCF